MSKKPTMSDALSSISSIYKTAKAQADSFLGESVPAGKYEMKLSDIKFLEKTKDNVTKLSLARTFTVLSGEHAGMCQKDFMALSNETGLSFALQFVGVMGYEIPSDPSGLPEIIEDMQQSQPTVIAEIVHSGEFVNVRVQECLESAAEEEEEEEEEDEHGLSDMSRAELKAFIKKNGLDVKVFASMSDDDIRESIKEELN